MRHVLRTLPVLCATLALAGCAGTQPTRYAELPVSSLLEPNRRDDADQTPYVYSTSPRWQDYTDLIIGPVDIYRGADGQFDDLSEEEKEALAAFMQAEFRQTLARGFRLVDQAGPRTLRLHLTLTGASSNTAVVSTFTRFDLVGGPVNLVQSIRGKEGMFIGSVSYAAELRDARDNRLLQAFVTKQYPNALNVGATFGRLGAARTGVEKGAEALLDQLRQPL